MFLLRFYACFTTPALCTLLRCCSHSLLYERKVAGRNNLKFHTTKFLFSLRPKVADSLYGRALAAQGKYLAIKKVPLSSLPYISLHLPPFLLRPNICLLTNGKKLAMFWYTKMPCTTWMLCKWF